MVKISNDAKVADIIVNCPVCRGLLGDEKMLSCGHSVCSKCLEGVPRTKQEENASQLECPNCKRECAMPDGGLQALPVNANLQALVLQLKEMPGNGDEIGLTSEDDAKSTSPTIYSAETSAEGCSQRSVAPAAASVESPRKVIHSFIHIRLR